MCGPSKGLFHGRERARYVKMLTVYKTSGFVSAGNGICVPIDQMVIYKVPSRNNIPSIRHSITVV